LSSALPEAKIDLASNGAEALEVFCKHHHAVLVMDLHMPVMDGKVAYFEIEKACKEKGWQMPAVVFCTGFAFPDTVKGIVAGNSAHCLLSKPVGSDVLVETVRKRLSA
jgi:CheY-like chemotaxis protein